MALSPKTYIAKKNEDEISFTNLVDKKYRDIAKIVIENHRVTEEDLEKIAEEENIELKKNIFGYNIEDIPKDSKTYIAYVLYQYTYQNEDRTEGLQIKLQSAPKHIRETILSLYGLMLGYTRLYLYTHFPNSKERVYLKFPVSNLEDFQLFNRVLDLAFPPNRKERLEMLKEEIFSLSFQEMLEKYLISARVLKSDIRQLILKLDIETSQKIELFRKFRMRIPKEIQQQRLEELLESEKRWTKNKLAKSIGCSLKGIRGLLGESRKLQ